MNIDAVSGSNPLSHVGPVVKADAKLSDSPFDVMLPNEAIVRENQFRATKNKVLKIIGYGVGAVGVGIGVGAVGLSFAAAAGGFAMCLVGIIGFGVYGAGVPLFIVGLLTMAVGSLALCFGGIILIGISTYAIEEVSKHYTAPKVPERTDIKADPEVLPVPPPREDKVTSPMVAKVKEPVADIDITTTENLIKMQRAKLKHVEQESRAWDKTGIFEKKDMSDRVQNPPKALVTEGKEPVADKDFKISKSLLKSKRAELKHAEQEKRVWDKTDGFENKDMIDRAQNKTPESSPSEIEDDEWGQ